MPAYDRLGGDHHQVLTPAGTPATSQHPEELVPEAELSTRPGASRPRQNSELMAQEQVFEHEVMARAGPGQDRREQQPEEFEHASKITDRRSRQVLPSHNCVKTLRRKLDELSQQRKAIQLGALLARRWLELGLVNASYLYVDGHVKVYTGSRLVPEVWDSLTRRFEAQLIHTALQITRGRRIEAAQKLGIGRNTITRKIQELGLDD